MTRSWTDRSPRWLILPLVGLMAAATPLADEDDGNYSVYLRVADLTEGTVAAVVDSITDALEAHGWVVLAEVPSDTGTACEADATTLVTYRPDLVGELLDHGTHAAFAIPIRITVFQDELGLHVGMMNPRSLFRTMVAEEGHAAEWDMITEDLLTTVTSALPEQTPVPYGQWRDKGRIGRTFGIMAGGPFHDKVETILK